MSKHTPGPWFLAEKVAGKHTTTNMRRIRSEREGMEHGAVCEVYGIADGSEAHANASLIAAAPELFAALQLMVDRFRDTEGSYGAWENEALEAANAAIAKATWGEG
jgi:hypothetical protein